MSWAGSSRRVGLAIAHDPRTAAPVTGRIPLPANGVGHHVGPDSDPVLDGQDDREMDLTTRCDNLSRLD